jgi:hypothetical protein
VALFQVVWEFVPLLSSSLLRDSATDRLLCVSNGHGEDIVAVRILAALQQQAPQLKLTALPLVGEGRAYAQLGIPTIGPVKVMPSGGFIYNSVRWAARDLKDGLLQLTLAQVRTLRDWAQQGGSVLAVGDIVPLLLAWLSGAPYAFVGTAKSEYYLRDAEGRLFPRAILEAWAGSVYYPWERWLMSRSRCQAVFPRDRLTTDYLKKWAIPAFNLGNPMMDGLEPADSVLAHQMADLLPPLQPQATVATPAFWGSSLPTAALAQPTVHTLVSPTTPDVVDTPPRPLLQILLLPGSRPPEAYANWQLMLQAVAEVVNRFPTHDLIFLTAIAPNLGLAPLRDTLATHGWINLPEQYPDSTSQWFTRQPLLPASLPEETSQGRLLGAQRVYLGLLSQQFGVAVAQADCAIGMAGTANEQVVGLGKPVITLPGDGPQFTAKFAESQTRLLGESVVLVAEPSQVATALQQVLADPARLHQIALNGRDRMGEPGAAARIASCLLAQLKALS